MQSVAVLRPHALLWRNPPVWPFLWRGLLPLAALALVAAFAVGPVAHDWIEGSVARETRSRLAAAGFSWVSVSASGQTVTLSGEEPAAGAGERGARLPRRNTHRRPYRPGRAEQVQSRLERSPRGRGARCARRAGRPGRAVTDARLRGAPPDRRQPHRGRPRPQSSHRVSRS